MHEENFAHADARDSAQEREPSRHDLTIRAASALFATFDVPRSPRSVQSFCKDGHIDCIRVKGPNGDRYFVNQKSVERYATELKQIEVVGKIALDEPVKQERETARGSAQERAAATSERASNHSLSDDHAEPSMDIIKALRDENLNLRIDNRAKEQFIIQLVEDRNSLMQSVQDVNYRLGAADARVQQFEGPRELARDSAHERAEEREAEVDAAVGLMEVSDTQPEPVVDVLVSPVDTPKRSFFGRIFGG